MAELAKACDRGSFTPEKKIEYERLMMNELDTKNRIYQAERRARAEGLEAGREEGAMNKAIETAKNLKENGVDMELIAKCTGLSVEQIKGL